MKKLVLTLTATLVCAAAFCQGVLLFGINTDNIIYFTTDTAHLNPADVGKTFDVADLYYGFGGPYPLAGSSAFTGPGINGGSGSIQVLAGSPSFVAALYAGTSSTSLSLQTTTTIDSWTNWNPGGIVNVAAFLPAPIAPGTRAWLQVQVFDSRADANAAGGGAVDAWVHPNMYAGVSPIFQATALVVPDYIYQTAPPVNSTWQPGGFFDVTDLNVIAPGYFQGGIALYANPGPPPPRPQIISQPANATNYWGQSVTFTVLATGDQPLWYQWQANGTNLSDGPRVSGSATNQLTLSAITLADVGSYRVIITNYAGSVTSRVATLTLAGAPRITQQPVSQVGYLGNIVTFLVTASGDPLPSYQWQKDGEPIAGATDVSLVLTNLQATNAGRYAVVVSNPLGSVTSSDAFLTISPAGVFLAMYSGITIDGVAGTTYGIQYSADLDNTNAWLGITNLTIEVPPVLWLDVQPAAQQQRWYRIVPGPIPIP